VLKTIGASQAMGRALVVVGVPINIINGVEFNVLRTLRRWADPVLNELVNSLNNPVGHLHSPQLIEHGGTAGVLDLQ
jgi:hypothetical protein